jgi:hypothetical protein
MKMSELSFSKCILIAQNQADLDDNRPVFVLILQYFREISKAIYALCFMIG